MDTDFRSRAAILVADTPRQIWELQQHIAPTHRKGEAGGGRHVKPTSRPPLSLDPVDAILDEQRELIRWSGIYGCTRGNVVQRVRHLLDAEVPEWDCENLIEQWGPIRGRNSARWPIVADETQWLDEFAAAKLVECTVRTLRRWKAKNPRLARQGKTCVEYSRSGLKDMQESMLAAKQASIQAMLAAKNAPKDVLVA
ncbi:hypothetical protein CH282_15285 [Rhodococcus sp. 06-418-1B]|nr:hypothetical protein [Rhodococcus sp. 06-418-1B]OZC84498.1 hypothetical protein CH282_15285 [Rhodococcus sp. 06-418-1B]